MTKRYWETGLSIKSYVLNQKESATAHLLEDVCGAEAGAVVREARGSCFGNLKVKE